MKTFVYHFRYLTSKNLFPMSHVRSRGLTPRHKGGCTVIGSQARTSDHEIRVFFGISHCCNKDAYNKKEGAKRAKENMERMLYSVPNTDTETLASLAKQLAEIPHIDKKMYDALVFEFFQCHQTLPPPKSKSVVIKAALMTVVPET